MTDADIRARFARVRADLGVPTPKAMSERLGIGENAWRGFESGTGTPSWATLGKLEAAGYSASWLLTGRGEMKVASAERSSRPLDPELMGRITDAIAKLHRAEDVRLPDVELGRIAMKSYIEIVDATGDPDEYPARLELMAVRLRKALRAAAESPETSKRRA